MSFHTRRGFLKRLSAGALLGSALSARARGASTTPLNILWITCEDTSPHLGCYGDEHATTPHLDRLASEGLRYTHAFSVSGVCAPSRSCLITGMYPTTLGTCHMRCKNPPPPDVRCFPAYLRRAGYYCSNNVKTDYQFDVPPDAWDDCSKTAHWRGRPSADSPFFAVFNFTTTHEAQIGNLDSLPPDLAERIAARKHDPARLKLPPYYPDTELIRLHWAHYYDVVTAMDLQAGDILHQLEQDGLADSTVVFFFSDHGAGLPRAKRWLYDSGLRVPFIVRWPGRISTGTVTDRLVSFVDFAPTVLSVAGVEIPGHIQGVPFLGEADGAPRDLVFAARDRMDERYDLIRAVRDRRYKYIRNYEPDRPYDQYLSYPESFPVMQEMRRVEKEGRLDELQKPFFVDRKPVEELYDTEADPHELRNLAGSSEHAGVLGRLRDALDEWSEGSRDLGFVPETELEAHLPANARNKEEPDWPSYEIPAEADATVFGRDLRSWIGKLNSGGARDRAQAMAAIGLVGSDAVPTLLSALSDPQPEVAYWAALGLAHSDESTAAVTQALVSALGNLSATVQLAAARGLCELGQPDPAVPVAVEAMKAPHFAVRLLAVDVLERATPRPEAATSALKAALEDENDYVRRIARCALNLPPQR